MQGAPQRPSSLGRSWLAALFATLGVVLFGAAVATAMAVEPAGEASPQLTSPFMATISGPPARPLTLDELDRYAALAGWPNEPGWWPEMRRIVLCETASLDPRAFNPDDPNGGSFGLAQLNGRYHFDRAGEDFRRWSDPVVNLRTALWLRTVRGRFGGEGGWANCAALLGIH
ncbi:hypothetical protein [Tepidiforma sp.]|uniref:hypothetical protein n=1 Tax=Tepidiforma sp. TaxID=2682230 RepID=UPI002ADD3CD8|nr:hypothetical protein [Tepidiforma sp.]